jgi:Tfp pilus assembly protein PilN
MAQTTGLLPIDPAVSPQQVNRILPIRANLLPSEITSVRNARRVRIGLAGTAVIVVLLLGAWYAFAVASVGAAEKNRDAVAEQVRGAQRQMKSHQELTSTVQEKEAITETLGKLLAHDLPWATLVDKVRAAGPKGLETASINGTLTTTEKTATSKAGAPLGTLTVTGNADDKKIIANYVDALGKIKGIVNPYLTTASQDGDDQVSFTITADVTADALCGEYTKSCTTGGK